MNFFQQISNQAFARKIDFSRFDLSHEHKTSMQFGKLVPLMCQEVLPGDKWHVNANAFLRTMPLLSPMMHKLDLKMRFFFVPNRLVWDGWERFISQGSDDNNQELFVPTFSVNVQNETAVKKYFGKGTLADYFGFGSRKDWQGFSVSQLPFRAYDLIYQEYFANQWLSPQNISNGYKGAAWYNAWGDVQEVTNENINNLGDMFLCENCCWEQDYFTAASPSPMVAGRGGTAGLSLNPSKSSVQITGQPTINDGLYPTQGSNNLSTISELRLAYRLQSFLENTLRLGKRYKEQLYAHFGVTSSDARLDRPEYLGGGKLAVQVSEVASTAEASQGNLGHLAGRGLSVGSFGDIDFTSEEHGYLFAIGYLSPHSSYFGGCDRTFLRRDRYDFAFPEFADLGEQPIWRAEIDQSDNYHDDPTRSIFGYVPRYSEYKVINDKFSGSMADDLAFWHLGRDFNGSNVQLNEDFVVINDKAREKLNRVFGVTDAAAHPFVATFGFNISALRPLPFNPQSVF